jgi:hypothetical protein
MRPLLLAALLTLLWMIAGCQQPHTPEVEQIRVVMRIHADEATSGRSAGKIESYEEAQTALVLLVPVRDCPLNYGTSSTEYDRNLLTLSSNQVELTIPIGVPLKLCLYFFAGTHSLAELDSGQVEIDGYGESSSFQVASDTELLELDVEFWNSLLSEITFKISSTSGVLSLGGTGTFKLSDSAGDLVNETPFQITDNETQLVTIEAPLGSYSYLIEVQGYSGAFGQLLVDNSVELESVELMPNLIDLSWIRLGEDMEVSSISDIAQIKGSLVLEIPQAEVLEITQFVASATLKNISNSFTVTFPFSTPLQNYLLSSDVDLVVYEVPFEISNVLLQHGENDFDLQVRVGGKSQLFILYEGFLYNSCALAQNLCIEMSWSDGEAASANLHTAFLDAAQTTTIINQEQQGIGSRKIFTVQDQKITHSWGVPSDGTYAVLAEDIKGCGSSADLQQVTVQVSGPGLESPLVLSAFDFKANTGSNLPVAPDRTAPFQQPLILLEVASGAILNGSIQTVDVENGFTWPDAETETSIQSIWDNTDVDACEG